MACGAPVVATAISGVTDHIIDRDTGYLVPPRDVATLAAAIGRVLDDPACARAMGERGRSVVVEHFSARAMVRQMEALYARLLDGKRPGAPAAEALAAAP
mgnify:CR=1 FL=1